MEISSCKGLKSFFGVVMSIMLIASYCIIYEEKAYAVLPIQKIEESEYYGRSQLAKMDNANALIWAYDKIADGVEESLGKISVHENGYNISVDEINMVYNAYRNDYPQHFWTSGAYSYSYYTSSTIISLTPKYSLEGTELEEAKENYKSAFDEILSNVNGDMSEFERELIIHDIIVDKVEYDGNAEHAHDAYGTIVDNKAVCEGYARAFQHLMYEAGILATTVTGTGNSEAHAWNLIRIDGNYYYIDVLWDDQSPNTYHEYFNLPFANMSLDHNLNNPVPTPNAESIEANYYNVMGGWLDELTVEGVVAEMQDDLNAEVYLNFDISFNEVVDWINSNIREIALMCGVTGGFSTSCGKVNRGYTISITPSSGTRNWTSVMLVELNQDSYEFENIGDTFKLEANVTPKDATNQNVTYSSSNTSVATVNKYTGLVKAIGAGSADIIATSEDGNKTAKCKVTVLGEEEELEGKLTLNGSYVDQIIDEGDKVILNVNAIGGSGDYTYQYKMYNVSTGKWSTLKSYSSDAQYECSDLKKGKYRFVVQVKDSKGTIKDTNKINVSVEANELLGNLTINASSSNQTVNVGESVTLKVDTIGGSGSYTYTYKAYNGTKWITLKSNASANVYVDKLTTTGYKKYVVVVKDSEGTTIDTNKITVTVQDTLKGELTVNGTGENKIVAVGNSVTLRAKATGGSGSYTYTYKAYNGSKWITLKSNSSDSTYIDKLTATGYKKYVVVIKDSQGNKLDTNKITITVRNSADLMGIMIVNESMENQTLKVGDSVKIEVGATGGSGSYTYTYKAYNGSKWITLKSNSSDSVYTDKVTTLEYKKYVVVVKDSKGNKVDTNKITVTVK